MTLEVHGADVVCDRKDWGWGGWMMCCMIVEVNRTNRISVIVQ
jgi:hypothetical protein